MPFFAFVLAAALCHPLSVSSSRVVVDGTHVRLELRCQAQTLIECLPIDTNRDRRIDAVELDRARESIATYVRDGYRLTADVGSADERRLAGRMTGAVIEPSVTSSATKEDLVDLTFEFDAAHALHDLRVDFELFGAADPMHRDHAQIAWNGGVPQARALWVEDPTWSFTPSAEARSVLGAYVSLGIDHILTGYDHIAFLIALVVGSRRLRSILAVVTAFTLAHSITLALASFGYVHLSASLVEPAIAASIAFVAIRNLLARDARPLWPEAFAFGLIHGLGFAGSIADTLASETQKAVALIGFNAGVEVGQITLVAGCVGLLWMLRKLGERTRSVPQAQPVLLAPRFARVAASLVVACLGAYWFVARVAGF
jgi:hydrogenase/urease accessory protein HupE